MLKNNNKLFPPRGTRRNCVTALGYDSLYHLIDIQGYFILTHKYRDLMEDEMENTRSWIIEVLALGALPPNSIG